jgi:hypothetical protein
MDATAAHAEIARCLAAHPGEEKRLLKAVELLQGGWVVPCLNAPGAVFVRSLKTGAAYRVTAGRCECRDSRAGRACKHRLARRLYLVARAAEDAQREASAKAVAEYDAHCPPPEEWEIDTSTAQEAPADDPGYDAWDDEADEDSPRGRVVH